MLLLLWLLLFCLPAAQLQPGGYLWSSSFSSSGLNSVSFFVSTCAAQADFISLEAAAAAAALLVAVTFVIPNKETSYYDGQ